MLNTPLLLPAGNVDHNTFTLDGNNIFHGMGKIDEISSKSNIYPIVNKHNFGDIDIKNLAEACIIEYKRAKIIMKTLFCKLPILPNASLYKFDLINISSVYKRGRVSKQQMLQIFIK